MLDVILLPLLLVLLAGSLLVAVLAALRGARATPAEEWRRYQLTRQQVLEPEGQQALAAVEEAEAIRARVAALLANPDAIQTVFQPIVDMADGQVVGVEALARMEGELDRSPGPWFAAATAAGLLPELELATMRSTLATLDDVPAGIYISINVSPGTVQASLTDAGVLMADELDLARMVVEITERELIDDYGDLLAALTESRARGIRVGIDDLGTGFAGLGHVLGLEPDIIKLDVSMTAGIDQDPVRRALARSIVSFTDEVGVALVAEGVETAAQRDALLAIGVRFGQGFLFRRPAPLPRGSTVNGDS